MARYQHLSLDGIIQEMISCSETFYSVPGIVRRVFRNFWHRRKPLISLAGNLSYRGNLRRDAEAYAQLPPSMGRQTGGREGVIKRSEGGVAKGSKLTNTVGQPREGCEPRGGLPGASATIL